MSLKKSELPTYLDLMTIVLSKSLLKAAASDNILTDKDRYSVDVTFLPFKLLHSEAQQLEELFQVTPLDAVSSATPPPVPNDIYRLKLTLHLTRALLVGLCVMAGEVVMDGDRLKKVKSMAERVAEFDIERFI
jgi:hypothetical protein